MPNSYVSFASKCEIRSLTILQVYLGIMTCNKKIAARKNNKDSCYGAFLPRV